MSLSQFREALFWCLTAAVTLSLSGNTGTAHPGTAQAIGTPPRSTGHDERMAQRSLDRRHAVPGIPGASGATGRDRRDPRQHARCRAPSTEAAASAMISAWVPSVTRSHHHRRHRNPSIIMLSTPRCDCSCRPSSSTTSARRSTSGCSRPSAGWRPSHRCHAGSPSARRRSRVRTDRRQASARASAT